MSRPYSGSSKQNATQLWLTRKVVKASVGAAEVQLHLLAAPAVACSDRRRTCPWSGESPASLRLGVELREQGLERPPRRRCLRPLRALGEALLSLRRSGVREARAQWTRPRRQSRRSSLTTRARAFGARHLAAGQLSLPIPNSEIGTKSRSQRHRTPVQPAPASPHAKELAPSRR